MSIFWPNGGTQQPAMPNTQSSGFRASGEYGMRYHPVTGNWKLHEGIDLIGISDGVIKAPFAGTVTISSYSGGYGNLIEITAPNGDRVRLAHNSRLLVSRGTWVSQGQRVAIWGTTGSSTGIHCHFEFIPAGRSAVNPRPVLNAANAGQPAGGGGTKPTPTPTPTPEEENEMSNSGFYYKRSTPANTIVYLIVNNDESTYHEYSNGNGGGAMPTAYNNAIAAAYKTGNFAPITEGHANVIKAQNSAKPGQETVILDWNDVEFAKFLAAIEGDNAAASASQVAAAPTVRA